MPFHLLELISTMAASQRGAEKRLWSYPEFMLAHSINNETKRREVGSIGGRQHAETGAYTWYVKISSTAQS